MPTRFVHQVIFAASVALTTGAVVIAARDRRIVDTVEVGNVDSEALHGYEGREATVGVANGRPFRQTRSWLHYTLSTFDDTDVTLACTFVGLATDNGPRHVDVVVNDSLIATRTLTIPSDSVSVVEILVPFGLTKGKTSIVVLIRARDGVTPALRELRTIQDHHQIAPVSTFPGVVR